MRCRFLRGGDGYEESMAMRAPRLFDGSEVDMGCVDEVATCMLKLERLSITITAELSLYFVPLVFFQLLNRCGERAEGAKVEEMNAVVGEMYKYGVD